MSDVLRPDNRRRWPRARAEWPITLALPDGTFEAQLRDVSSSGLCFFLDREIPEMTVLQVRLDLPDGGREIRAVGAVVRCKRVSPAMEHFEVALFLQEITPTDKDALAEFVASGAEVGTSD
jgi:hypothetical protein